eukprot:3251930-Alexandrium_andersonii.AAC.1
MHMLLPRHARQRFQQRPAAAAQLRSSRPSSQPTLRQRSVTSNSAVSGTRTGPCISLGFPRDRRASADSDSTC